MSLLSHNELVQHINAGMISHPNSLLPFPIEQVNGASVDLTLGDKMLIESRATIVNLARKESTPMEELPLSAGQWSLYPGDFVLAHTREYFRFPPDIAGHYMLKSSLARSGLQHLMAGFADPTWHGSLTLELVNQTKSKVIVLEHGMKIGQMLFFRCTSAVPAAVAYAARGQYQGDSTVMASKGVR
jgi:dCTP deaminase